MLQSHLVYGFDSPPVANRFINTLKNWPKAEVSAKLYRGSSNVMVSYYFDGKGFDTTASELDDLADRFDGKEIPDR
ncbi:hypothetical protein QX776_10350 [Alteromonadaceae bacterium BrNp21-10]|nr:hypothetical protein [Alteromonadaceae bacterium BrNp21-10]